MLISQEAGISTACMQFDCMYIWDKVFKRGPSKISTACMQFDCMYIWDKVFKRGPSKICERQASKNLTVYGLLEA